MVGLPVPYLSIDELRYVLLATWAALVLLTVVSAGFQNEDESPMKLDGPLRRASDEVSVLWYSGPAEGFV